MSTTVYTADEWDRLNAMPEPMTPFIMTCDEGHETVVTHFQWHAANLWPCAHLLAEAVTTGRCPGQIDFAHARRHVSCPCDEVTAPGASV